MAGEAKDAAAKEPDPKKGSAKERSPNYPQFTLTDCLVNVRKLYEREKRSSVPPAVAVQAFGYTVLSGTARAVLAALKSYGLVEGGENGVRVSDLAMTLLFGVPGSDEHKAAFFAASRKPPLFAELSASHAEGSDENLRSYLITKRGFSSEGAGRFIVTFRDAMKVENQQAPGYSDGEQGGGDTSGDAGKSGAGKPSTPAQEPKRNKTDAPNPGAFMEFTWPLSGDAVATLTVTRKIEADDIETLTSYFEIAKRALQKAARTQLAPPQTSNAEAARPQEG